MLFKRNYFIAGFWLLLGVVLTYLTLQNMVPKNTSQCTQSTKSQVVTSTSLPTSLSPNLKLAMSRVEQEGYTVDESNTFGYEESSSLNVLIGTATGSADGYNKKAFFFYNGEYLGTDTSGASAQINVAWRDDKTIAINYILYKTKDPLCCPTAGAATVRFQWNGNKMVALDPIPPTDWSINGHR